MPYLDPEKEKAKKRRWLAKQKALNAEFAKAQNNRPKKFPNRFYRRFNLDTEAAEYLAFVAALEAAGVPKRERTTGLFVTVSFEKPGTRPANPA